MLTLCCILEWDAKTALMEVVSLIKALKREVGPHNLILHYLPFGLSIYLYLILLDLEKASLTNWIFSLFQTGLLLPV